MAKSSVKVKILFLQWQKMAELVKGFEELWPKLALHLSDFLIAFRVQSMHVDTEKGSRLAYYSHWCIKILVYYSSIIPLGFSMSIIHKIML